MRTALSLALLLGPVLPTQAGNCVSAPQVRATVSYAAPSYNYAYQTVVKSAYSYAAPAYDYVAYATIQVPVLPVYFTSYVEPPVPAAATAEVKASATDSKLDALLESNRQTNELLRSMLQSQAPAGSLPLAAAPAAKLSGNAIQANCLKCHSGGEPKGDFSLDDACLSKNDKKAIYDKYFTRNQNCLGAKPLSAESRAELSEMVRLLPKSK